MANKFDLNDSTPTPPSGKVNVRWQSDVNGNVSAYVDPPGGGSGAVSSVFGRTGAVVAASGDYSASQITNAVDTTQVYSNPAWIGSLAWSKITGAPATGVSSVFGRSGAVTSQSGDYSAAMVTNAVDQTATYSNPAWISALAWSKITGAPTLYTDPLTTKGDLVARGTSTTRLGVGSDGQVLTSDSAQSLGVKWATPASAPVSSVFTRTGAVVAVSGDYTAAMVTNAVDQTATYSNPAWITSLAWSKITGAPSVSSYQTPWLSDIDGASHMLSSASAIGIGIAANTAWPLWIRQNSAFGTGQALMENIHADGAGGFNVTNNGSFIGGFMLCGSNYPNSAWRNTLVLYTQGAQPIAFGTNNSEKMRLSAAGNLGIGNAASVLPMGASTAVQLIVGDTAASSARTAMITLATNNPSGAAMGLISFANYNLAGTDKRIASIHGVIGATPDSGEMIFYTWNAGSVAERMRISAAGNVTFQGLVGIGTQATFPLAVREGADKCIVFQPVGGGSAAIQVTNDAANTFVPMEYAASKHVFTQGPVGINTATVPDQLTIYTGNPSVCRMAGVSRGAIWYNDNASFYLLMTNSGDPLGPYNSFRPFFAEFATGIVTMAEGVKCGTNANIFASGDFGTSRNSSPNTGVAYFGNTGGKYLFYDGTNFQMNGGSLYVNGTLVSTSDLRTKQNIRDLTGGLSLIEQLRPKEFEFNGLHGTPKGQRAVSLIAQDLQAVSPASVETNRSKHPTTGEQADLLYYNPQEITMHLVLAVQQLQARLKALEAR